MSIIDIWPLQLLFWVFWPFWRLSVQCILYGFVFEVGGMILEIMGDCVLEKAEKFEIKFQYLWPIQMDCWIPLGYNKTALFLYFLLILHQCLSWYNLTLRRWRSSTINYQEKWHHYSVWKLGSVMISDIDFLLSNYHPWSRVIIMAKRVSINKQQKSNSAVLTLANRINYFTPPIHARPLIVELCSLQSGHVSN